MVQGMAFLSKKGFNPHNQVNRKQVYEAQQHSKQQQERIRRREEQLRREREDEELCAARHNGDASQAQLRFMYDAPPGLKKEEQQAAEEAAAIKKSAEKARSEAAKDLTQVQPGDDAAAAAFRRMLAATTQPTNESFGEMVGNDTQEGEEGEAKLGFAPVLQGSNMEKNLENANDSRSALEKAVGRRDRGGALTLDEQISRFPQLKNAPMAKGMNATDVNVSFKPLGAQMRNVKCLACGIWGHSRGDRECQTTGWDPFSAASRPLSSSIRPSNEEDSTSRQDKRADDTADRRQFNQRDDGDDSSSSSSSSSSDYSRGERKRKHRSKHKKKEKESSRHRKRSRKHRSESSPSRRSKSRSHKKRRSGRDDH